MKRSVCLPCLAVIVAGAAVGCAGSRATAAATSPSGGSALATAPSKGAAPTCWSVHAIQGTPLTVAVPPGWQTRPPAFARDMLLSGGAEESDPNVAFIDAGHQKLMAIGLAPVGMTLVTVRLLVLDGDPDLERAVERSKELSKGVPVERRQESTVNLPIGPARRSIEERGGGSQPARNITYVLLVDGHTLILTGTSPADDLATPELVDTMAASISRVAPVSAD